MIIIMCALCFQTNLMILYLEAVNYKVVTALATLEGHPPAASNTFSQHIETTRDKNGHQMSVLKVRAYLLISTQNIANITVVAP